MSAFFSQKHPKMHSVLLSFLFFSILFIVTDFMLMSVRFAFRKLSLETKIVWTQTVVHLVFALITSPLALWYLLLDNSLGNDIVNSTTIESKLLMCITIGFMVCELTTLVALKYTTSRLFNRPMFFQDLVVITGACLLLHCDRGHFFGLIAIAIEGVYIFNSVSWMLKQTGSFGRSWKLLQVMTIHLCNYCPLVGIYCLMLSYQQLNSLLENVPLPILVLLYTCLLTEMFIVIPAWSVRLMEDLQRIRVVKIPSGIYKLCSVSLAQTQDTQSLK